MITQKKPRSKKKDALLDPFTKRLLGLLSVVVPLLAYLILKPTPHDNARAIEQTREFAQFIQSKPELAQPPVNREVSSVPQDRQAAAPTSIVPPPQQTEQPASDNPDPNALLTLDDRITVNNYSSQWNQVDFVRDHNWRDQIELVFSIAERTHSPDVYDLLRRQVILGKVDEDQSNRIRSETWFERYMKFETRPVPRKEMEDLFIHNDR